MKTTIVINEDHTKNGVDWSVSFDGYNTGDGTKTVKVASKEDAFKLKELCKDHFTFHPKVDSPSIDEALMTWFNNREID